MHAKSAIQILTHIMKWSNEDVTDNLADLQALSGYGYDEYQQFKPGMRFIESLASWLNQMPLEKRQVAFRFVKERLLYITQDQMKQIISVAYPEYIVPILLKQLSRELTTHPPYWNVKRLLDSNEFQILLSKCLLVGLSDGSQIDIFRRSNSALSHEQIYRTHEFNNSRQKKIKEALEKKLAIFHKTDAYFRNVFLLDDFSASGISYLEEDPETQYHMKGKLECFHSSIIHTDDPISKLVNTDDLRVWLVLYIATEYAKTRLQSLGSKLFSPIPFAVIVIHTLPDNIKYLEGENSEFTELIKNKKFGWETLVDEHFKKGDTTKPYLGFDACALPLILNHNTPNNTLPILYRNDKKTSFKGLFPRVSRHQ